MGASRGHLSDSVIYLYGITAKHGNPVGMGIRLVVLPQLWGWVYVDCELMHQLETVHLQVSLGTLEVLFLFYRTKKFHKIESLLKSFWAYKYFLHNVSAYLYISSDAWGRENFIADGARMRLIFTTVSLFSCNFFTRMETFTLSSCLFCARHWEKLFSGRTV